MHGPITSILFADTDDKRRPRLSIELEADGFAVIPAITDEQARVKARNEQPHALLLGAGDTPTSPLRLLEQFRTGDVRTTGVAPDVAAIVLAQPGELSLLRAFDRGADDVVGPEVSYLELRARLGAVMRRLRGDLRGTQAVFGRLVIDRTGRRATYAGRELNLSTLEYKLLERLTAEPARVFTKSELLAEVWGMPDGIQTRASTRRPAGCGASWPRSVPGTWSSTGAEWATRSPTAASATSGRSVRGRGCSVRRRRGLTRTGGLRRSGGLRRAGPPIRRTPLRRAQFTAASPAQRAKVLGLTCLVCGRRPVDPAHLVSRARGGCDHPDCVIALCRAHHRAFDRGELDVLPWLEPGGRAELAHALTHVALLALLQRVTATRWTPANPTTERRAA